MPSWPASSTGWCRAATGGGRCAAPRRQPPPSSVSGAASPSGNPAVTPSRRRVVPDDKAADHAQNGPPPGPGTGGAVRRLLRRSTGRRSGTAPAAAHPTTTLPTDPGAVRGPVYIDSVDLLLLESWPVQVRASIKGSLPTPCHRLAWDLSGPDAQGRITLDIYSTADPDGICIQVLEPFEQVHRRRLLHQRIVRAGDQRDRVPLHHLSGASPAPLMGGPAARRNPPASRS